MSPVYLTLGLPFTVIVFSAVLGLAAVKRGGRVAFFVPLTTLLIAFYASTAVQGLADRRGSLVVVGLLMAALGTALRNRSRAAVYAGLAGMMVCFAISVYTGFSRTGLLVGLLPSSFISLTVLLLNWRYLRRSAWPGEAPWGLLLAGIFPLLSWQAAERWLELGVFAAPLVLLVALSLAIAALLQQTKAALFAMALYYLAQWLMALSLLFRYYATVWLF